MLVKEISGHNYYQRLISREIIENYEKYERLQTERWVQTEYTWKIIRQQKITSIFRKLLS